MNTGAALWALLGYGIFPLWLAAGAADWLCHRATHIERTSGPRESAFHLLLFAEIALPVLLVLFLQVRALVLAITALCVLVHFATSLADTRYAQPRRHISPLEQMVHSFLDVVPLAGLAVLCVLHADQFREPHWELAWRTPAAGGAAITLVVGGLLLAFALIVEEWRRGQRFTS